MKSKSVTLQDMLSAREHRASIQESMLQSYHAPVISFTLNIPGPQKVFSGIPQAYLTGCHRIEWMLAKHGLAALHVEHVQEHTGLEAFYSVKEEPLKLKALMARLEDQDALGRLFDIDVIRSDGSPVSRTALGLPARRCLLCGEEAHSCARSRRHSVEELTGRIKEILEETV